MGVLIVKRKVRMKERGFLEKLGECYSISTKNETLYPKEE
jgi:hypothetical protein